MRNIKRFGLVLLFILMHISLCFAKSEGEDILNMVDAALESMPQKLAAMDAGIKRAAFASLKVDRKDMSMSLMKQIQGKIEGAFTRSKLIIMVYSPEFKPMKIVSKGDRLKIVTGIQDTEKLREISEKLDLDAILEGELFVTKNRIYLNLRIIDMHDMSVLWSEEFSNKKETKRTESVFIDGTLSIAGMQLTETSTSSGTIPGFAQYYMLDLRVLQKVYLKDKIKFTLSGGILPLYSGIEDATNNTIVSGESLASLTNFFGRLGFRISIIPAITEAKLSGIKLRDWLAIEFNYGKLYGAEIGLIDLFGIKFECDITRNISIGAGLSYTSPTEIIVGPVDSTVKAGGIFYEVSLLRISFVSR